MAGLAESFRNPVDRLPKATTWQSSYLLLILLYAATLVFVVPFVLGGVQRWDSVSYISIGFCVGIFFLPVIGLFFGYSVLRKASRASTQSADVDQVTQELFQDDTFLQNQYREGLQEKYEKGLPPGAAHNLMIDAIRRAYSDRWEVPRRLVETHAGREGRGLHIIASLQRLSLQIGILGAFVGLMLAFQSDVFRVVAHPEEVNLGGLIDALKFKFGASIAGLVASTYLILLHQYCRRFFQIAMDRLETMTDNILELAKRLRHDPHSSIGNDMSQIRERVDDMTKAVQGVSGGHEKVVQSIEDGSLKLGGGLDAFDKRVQGLMARQDAMLSQVGNFYNAIDPAKLVTSMKSAMQGTAETLAAELKAQNDALKGLRELLALLTDAQLQRVASHGELAQQNQQVIALLSDIRNRLRGIEQARPQAPRSWKEWIPGWRSTKAD